MKKISLFISLGIILLGICGCTKKDDNGFIPEDFIGEWELDISNEELEKIKTYFDNDEIYLPLQNFNITALDKPDSCQGIGCKGNVYQLINGKYRIEENRYCLELIDIDTLKQVACGNESYQLGSDNIKNQYDFYYKRVK